MGTGCLFQFTYCEYHIVFECKVNLLRTVYRNVTNSISPVVTDSIYRARASILTPPRGYKTLFMLNSAEHEISTVHKN